MIDPTPQPLLDAHDDLCADQVGGDSVRNIYVRRVGETLDEDGEPAPAQHKTAERAARPARKNKGR